MYAIRSYYAIDDLKSRKMWALPGVTANVIKGTGSAVVAGPAVQMLEIISKGVVDGYTGVPFSSVVQFKLKDRITSYNVCYTKLLRFWGRANCGRVRAAPLRN